MNLIACNGSPHREGNTARLLEEALRGARTRGAQTRMVHLNDLTLRGCQGCMACQGNGGFCIEEDALHPLLEEIRTADGILLGSPVYMRQLSAQLRALVDRFYCFLDIREGLRSRLAHPKPTVLVLAQGNPDPEMPTYLVENTTGALETLGFSVERTIRACGVLWPGDVEKQPEILAAAFEAGAALVR